MVPKKKQSKRQTTKMRNKIDKKVKEHHRKIRKEAKKNPKKSSKKDPGIPNSLPFKEKLLQEIEENKQKEKKTFQNPKNPQTEQDKLKKILQKAADRSQTFDGVGKDEDQEKVSKIKDGSKKAFYREFQKVVELADVVVQVLDARDPLGCRDLAVEEHVREKGKKLILLLNKIDLVPKDNVTNWIKYLKNEHPTIPFKASTQSQRTNLGQSSDSNSGGKDCCFGAEDILNILKNYCRDHKIKTSITVGVVGMPNVGKSSFINSLKRTRVCQVGSQPGITRSLQEISLDKNIKLLDSPGIVFGSPGDTGVLLRNVVRLDQIEDPIEVVQCIIDRCNKHQLMSIYEIPIFDTAEQFLLFIANVCGKLKKGGVADLDGAARHVIQDWNNAKIPYFSVPPVRHDEIESSIVNELGQEMKIESVMMEE